MDETDTDAARRARAHAIWEREGRPEGRHAEHWEAAGRELADGGGDPEAAPAEPTPPVGSTGEREARGHGDKPIPNSAPANPRLEPPAQERR